MSRGLGDVYKRQTGGRARGGVLAVSGANTAVWAKQMTKQSRVQTNRVGCTFLGKMPQVWKCLRG